MRETSGNHPSSRFRAFLEAGGDSIVETQLVGIDCHHGNREIRLVGLGSGDDSLPGAAGERGAAGGVTDGVQERALFVSDGGEHEDEVGPFDPGRRERFLSGFAPCCPRVAMMAHSDTGIGAHRCAPFNNHLVGAFAQSSTFRQHPRGWLRSPRSRSQSAAICGLLFYRHVLASLLIYYAMYHANLHSEKAVCIASKSARIERPRGTGKDCSGTSRSCRRPVFGRLRAKADVGSPSWARRYDPPLVHLARDAISVIPGAAQGFDAARSDCAMPHRSVTTIRRWA